MLKSQKLEINVYIDQHTSLICINDVFLKYYDHSNYRIRNNTEFLAILLEPVNICFRNFSDNMVKMEYSSREF